MQKVSEKDSNYLNTTLFINGELVSKDHDRLTKDILVQDDIIAQIDDHIIPEAGVNIVDAKGKIISPGFINIHSHCDFYLPIPEHAQLYERLLFQGITTNVGGNCGFSFFPIKPDRFSGLEDYQGFFRYKDFAIDWQDADSFFERLENRMMFNYIPLAGHGSLRVNAAGFSRQLGGDEAAAMATMLRESLAGGCFGLSSGLMYMPGTFSETKELAGLAKIVKEFPNTIYASHLRGYSATFIEAIEESIQIGQITGIPVQISHIGPFGVKYGSKIGEALTLIEKARAAGVNVAYDTLSYCGSDTLGVALFPPWAYEEGIEAFIENLKNADFWEKVLTAMQTYIPKWPSWEGNGWTDNFFECCGIENIYIQGAGNQDLVGKSLVEIGRMRKLDPWEALRQITIEERANFNIFLDGIGGDLYGDPEQENFDALIEHPVGLYSVDALFDKKGGSWLEAYGAFPHIFDKYVRRKRTVSLQDFIERITARIAERFHISDRGYLREGCKADLVIFDINNYKDNAALFDENPAYASGVEYVMINGEFVIERSRRNDALPGRVIRNL